MGKLVLIKFSSIDDPWQCIVTGVVREAGHWCYTLEFEDGQTYTAAMADYQYSAVLSERSPDLDEPQVIQLIRKI